MSTNVTLRALGLSEKEIRLYLALLKSGKTKPAHLAAATKINRATVYALAKNLISKGLAAEDLSGKTAFLLPLPPENLGKIVEESKREIREKEALVKKAIGELSMIAAGAAYPVPRIQFVREHDLEKFQYDNMHKWTKACLAEDGIWWGYQDHSWAELMEKFIPAFHASPESKHPTFDTRLFSNASPIERKLANKFPRRHIKFLKDTDFTATMWVCGDYLVMINTREHPFYLFEIHDKALAHNTREIFKKMWSEN